MILGAGITGLAAAYASGAPVFERAMTPGGLCATYYVRAGDGARHASPPANEEAYRFERGGGHWIWGADLEIESLIASFSPVRRYERRASVYFADRDLHVAYPVQQHLDELGPDVADSIRLELNEREDDAIKCPTMAADFRRRFGATLCRLFFDPFHARYTSGLYEALARSDYAKTPAIPKPGPHSLPAGYNPEFAYPRDGLDALARGLAARSTVHYGKEVIGIDTARRSIHFADGGAEKYDVLVSTLSLKQTLEMAAIRIEEAADPHTSVLVANLGALRARRCPIQHWTYVPSSRAGFHRVGFYDNIDPCFLPKSRRDRRTHASLYIEWAFPGGGSKPDEGEVARLMGGAIDELQGWGWIGEVEVASHNWIDTAYAWTLPESRWPVLARHRLAEHGIHLAGRYATWTSDVREQGIAHSIGAGLAAAGLLSGRARP